MTTTRYVFARIAQAFGISRRQRRMAEAASEMHLLREAEQFLGQNVWQKVEEVEELGIEYWNLRRLVAEREELKEKLVDSENVLADAHDQRASLLSAKTAPQVDLEEKRSTLLSELEARAQSRDLLVAKAREVRRVYDGMRTKLEVLSSEKRIDEAIHTKTKTRMNELREQFSKLKRERDEIAKMIALNEADLDEIEGKLDEERKRHRSEAAEAFQQIGEANRNISAFKAELGLIETQMQQLFGEIGRHVSRNISKNPTCYTASKNFRPMVEVMRALRRSISMNHRLAGI